MNDTAHWRCRPRRPRRQPASGIVVGNRLEQRLTDVARFSVMEPHPAQRELMILQQAHVQRSWATEDIQP